MKETPNPGSKEAQEMGCKCPVVDNHYGKGFMMDGEISFWYTQDCPVHIVNLKNLGHE